VLLLDMSEILEGLPQRGDTMRVNRIMGAGDSSQR
jgi:hypothetical protein